MEQRVALDEYLRDGRVILLLDALNEMPHQNNAEYASKVSLWRTFTQAVVAQGNRFHTRIRRMMGVRT